MCMALEAAHDRFYREHTTVPGVWAEPKQEGSSPSAGIVAAWAVCKAVIVDKGATTVMSKKSSASSSSKTQNVMFRGIPRPLWQRLKVQAAEEGVFLKDLIVRILEKGAK